MKCNSSQHTLGDAQGQSRCNKERPIRWAQHMAGIFCSSGCTCLFSLWLLLRFFSLMLVFSNLIMMCLKKNVYWLGFAELLGCVQIVVFIKCDKYQHLFLQVIFLNLSPLSLRCQLHVHWFYRYCYILVWFWLFYLGLFSPCTSF